MSPRVLIADDNAALADLVVMMGAERGWDMIAVTNGTHVWPLLRGEFLDAAIIDVRMPPVDGLHLLHALRDAAGTVPVIIWSGETHPVHVELMRRLTLATGGQAFVSKDEDVSVLLDVVQGVLEKSVDGGAS